MKMDNQATENDLLKDFHSVTSLEEASTGQRFANYLVDLVAFIAFMFLYGVLSFFVVRVTGISIDPFDEDGNGFVQNIYSLLFYAFFYSVVEGLTKGRSLGKLTTRTKVVHKEGQPLKFKDFVLRSLCRIVPFEPFSAFGGYPWHDTWTKTRVVQIR